MRSEFFQLANAYVDACCFSLSTDNFNQILSKKVQLSHQTNKEEPVIKQGRYLITGLYKQYIFDNTFDINLKQVSLEAQESRLLLKLRVEENKQGLRKVNRFIFEETTLFHFKAHRGGHFKICKIETKVERTPV